MRQFISELKRRGVVPVAAVYIVSIWVVLQAADILFPVWDISARNIRLIVYAAMLGFPIALIFGWRYDITANGISRTPPATEDEREALDRSLRRRDFVTLGALVVATILIGSWLVGELTRGGAAMPVGPANSVAVLPFEVEEGAGEALPDIADRLVSALISIDGLKVTGRESSFYFRDSDETLDRIGIRLGARHLVTGRLGRNKSAANLSVQLVRLPELDTIWANTYTVATDQFGAVVRDIGTSVASAMGLNVLDADRVRIAAQLGDDPGLTRMIRLAELQASKGDWDEARALADQAAELFPQAVKAQVSRARLYLLNYSSSGQPPLVELLQVVADSLDTASALGADTPEYYYARAMQARRQIRSSGATPALEKALEDNFERAIALNPSDAQAYVSYSIHFRRKRNFTRAAELLETALDYDPLHPGAIWQYSRILSAFERHDEALAYAQQLPEYFDIGYGGVADVYLGAGQIDRGIESLQADPRMSDFVRWRIAILWARLRAPQEAIAVLQSIRDDDTLVPVAQSLIDAMEGNNQTAYDRLARLVDETGTQDPRVIRQAVDLALRLGRFEDAIRLTEHRVPGLRDPVAPLVEEAVATDALQLAFALTQIGGNDVRAGILSSQLLNGVRNRPRMGWDAIGVRDALVYAYQGDTGRAIEAIRDAYDAGWRHPYDELGMLSLPLESLVGIDEFDRILAAIDEDLAKMRASARRLTR